MIGRLYRKDGKSRCIVRMAMVSSMVLAVTACGPASNPQTFLDSIGPSADASTDMALAALARGDFGRAEREVEAALKRDPKNPYALLAGGLLYQNTGRPVRARALYEELLSLRPNQMAAVGDWGNLKVLPIADIAATNMRRVDAELARAGGWRSPKAASLTAPSYTDSAIAAPLPATTVQAMPKDAGHAEALASLDPKTQAIADRFTVLRKLKDDQMITPDEYAARRAANIGALLPLTQSPPAKDLDRPVPALDQVVDRLRSLQQALQTRAITPREHAMERDLILDALLPLKPATLAVPEPAPRDLIASAERVRQLERLRGMGLISDAEMRAEQKAVENAMRTIPDGPGVLSATESQPRMLIPSSGGKPPLPGQLAIHLASYRSEQQAQDGWEEMRKRFRPQLATLAPDIRKSTVPGKGDFYRLYAGPFDKKIQADKVCQDLRKKRQFCTVTSE